MSYLDAIILGILQGLTEFLPVSSSGHLVLTQAVLNVKQPGVSFEIVLHLGTLLAVLIYFRKRVCSLMAAVFDRSMTRERSIILYLIIGTIPAPKVDAEAAVQLLVGSLDYDSHRGRIAIGRVHRGVMDISLKKIQYL